MLSAVSQLIFGTSAAGYRCEGGYNGSGDPQNNWFAWERAQMAPPSLRCDLWDRPGHVLDLAQAAGCQAFVISVEWARVEPEAGKVDHQALDAYGRLMKECAARAMVPIVALHDVAHPGWLGEELWLTPGAPDRFAEHVGRVVEALGTECAHWVTTRQANAVALAGWVGGHHPPRRFLAPADAWAVADNLLAAHVLAHEVIHEAREDAEVSLGLRRSSIYEWQRGLLDVVLAPSLGVERGDLGAFSAGRAARHGALDPPRTLGGLAVRQLSGRLSGHLARREGRRLKATTPGRTPETATGLLARSADLVYARHARGLPPALDSLYLLWRPPSAGAFALPGKQRLPHEPRPDPGALGAWLQDQGRLTPGLRVWIEDGFVTRAPGEVQESWDRAAYLRHGLGAARDAAGTGVDVAGYLYHSITGGAEPTWPKADFGLVPQGASEAEATRVAASYGALVRSVIGDQVTSRRNVVR